MLCVDDDDDDLIMIVAIAKFEVFRSHFLKESARHFALFLNLE